jgi:hypothetical protein
MDEKLRKQLKTGGIAVVIVVLLLFSGYFWLALVLALGGWFFTAVQSAPGAIVRIAKAVFKRSSGSLR